MLINNIKYQVLEDYKNAFDETVVKEKMTDYFEKFDYIVGDWAFSSLRLKGFCKPENKNFNQINDFQNKEKYLKEYCTVDCKYFVLEKNN